MSTNEIRNKVNNILISKENPSKYIKDLIEKGEFNQQPFNLIKDLRKIDQNKKYHPEGNVLNHVLLVVDEASKYKNLSKNKEIFMWSALLHDIGKLTTTRVRRGRITSYNHDTEGEKIAYDFLSELGFSEESKISISKLVRYHMQPLFYDKNLPFFEPSKMLKDCDYNEIALLSLCDRLGRSKLTSETVNMEKERIDKFKQYCKNH